MNNNANNFIDGSNALKIDNDNLVDEANKLENNVAPTNNENNIYNFPSGEAGKQVDENGNVSDTATKKTIKAVGRGVGAYFTGGTNK